MKRKDTRIVYRHMYIVTRRKNCVCCQQTLCCAYFAVGSILAEGKTTYDLGCNKLQRTRGHFLNIN